MPGVVPEGDGTTGLQPLGLAGQAAHLILTNDGNEGQSALTSVALFDQGLVQILQASVTGLEPQKPYILALASKPDGSGTLEPLSAVMTNPAGSAIVNATGPIRQIVQNNGGSGRRYLVIAEGTAAARQRITLWLVLRQCSPATGALGSRRFQGLTNAMKQKAKKFSSPKWAIWKCQKRLPTCCVTNLPEDKFGKRDGHEVVPGDLRFHPGR